MKVVTMKSQILVPLIFMTLGLSLGQEEPVQNAGSKEIEPGKRTFL